MTARVCGEPGGGCPQVNVWRSSHVVACPNAGCHMETLPSTFPTVGAYCIGPFRLCCCLAELWAIARALREHATRAPGTTSCGLKTITTAVDPALNSWEPGWKLVTSTCQVDWHNPVFSWVDKERSPPAGKLRRLGSPLVIAPAEGVFVPSTVLTPSFPGLSPPTLR